MNPIRLLAAATAALLAAPAAPAQGPLPPMVQPRLPTAPPDYTRDEAWLCLPGRPDACGRPLGTVALNANGYGSIGQVTADPKAPVDCFYVYPTVSRDSSLNSDLTPGLEENAAAAVQLARFGTVCRPFAPLYRQLTIASLARSMGGENVLPNLEVAYGDVLSAWREFLAHRNSDRPFVLIGHSQGSIHLLRLLQNEIDGKPVAKRMLSAILLGWTVEVPPGKLVGGSLKRTPLCSRGGQTGCVVTYMTFRAAAPPPQPSFLGRAATPGMTAACTNPAALAGGSGKLDSYWFTLVPPQAGAEPISWSSQGAPPVPFVRTEGLVTAICRHNGSAGWLAVTVEASPNDARTDVIPGDVYMMGKLNPGWGMHLADMSIAQGDLIALVAAQSGAYRRARKR